MRSVRIRSDYDPDTSLLVSISDDGDCSFRIFGDGEMRIATSGGQFHGDQLVLICGTINRLVDLNCNNGTFTCNRKKGDM